MTDQQLLANYQSGDATALCELISRHLPMVHAAALREVRDPHLADDITQAVFLVLMRRAKDLPRGTVLAGWLFKTTLYAAADARKLQKRRTHHEREATVMYATTDSTTPALAEEIHAQLNAAIASLSAADRDAVVLRYLQGQPPAAIAVALGTTENTARQRVARALERLRKHFAKRGSIIALAALVALLDALPTHAAPADLTARLRDVATGKAQPTPLSQTLAQGATRMERQARLTRNTLLTTAAAAAILALCLPLALAQRAPVAAPAGVPVSPASGASIVALPDSTRGVQLAQATPITPTPAPAPTAPKSDAQVIQAAVDAHTAFAVDVYQQLNKTQANDNLFLSPFSISTIMGLTAAGARGNTLVQMNKVLHLSDLEAIHAGVSKITHQLTDMQGGKKPYQLSIANALWEDQTNPFKPDFLALSQKYYDLSGLTTLSFKDNPEAARALINKWVEDKTQTRIQELLPPRSITADTGLVLTNAIYFKGEWVTPFDPIPAGRGRPTPVFYVTATKTVQPTNMQITSEYPYFENTDLQAVSLPYKAVPGVGNAQQVSMVIVLPKKRDGLAALEKTITPEALAQWTTALAATRIAVTLPKFTITCPTKLTDTFKTMGMADAFSELTAHLEGISTPPPGKVLFISDVFHKAFIKVDEKGTEAAAATAVVGGLGGGMPRPVPIFRADHPFFFFIRYEPTNSILFMGHLVDPSAGANAAAPARGPARGPAQPAAGPLLKQPKAVATAALEIAATTRADTAFASPTRTGFMSDLTALETAAKAVLNDQETDPAVSQQLNLALSQALNQAITRTATIANRASESTVNQDKSRQLGDKLRALGNL